MPDLVTFSKPPRNLPWREQEYTSTNAAVFLVWFSRNLYVSAARKIKLAIEQAELEPGEVRPSLPTISSITRIVDELSRTRPLTEPGVSVFHGEAVVTWKRGAREISLLSRGSANDPKLLRYTAGQDEPSQHQIATNATAQDLKHAIAWLYE